MNSVNIIGNITNDLELAYTPSGSALCKFGLALNEKFKDKETTVFLNIVTWGKTAESCKEYLHKGSKVGITGRLSYSQWETHAREKRSKVEVTADRVMFLDNKEEGPF